MLKQAPRAELAAPEKLRRVTKHELNPNDSAAWHRHTEECSAAAAASLIVSNLDDHERAFLGTCQKLYRQETGCNTPFEEFFLGLVHHVEWGYSLPTPDEVQGGLETFRENFDCMQREARAFVAAYPEKEPAHA